MTKEHDQPCTYNGRITRIDGTEIDPDVLTRHIQKLMEEAAVYGLAITIFNDHHITYDKVFGYRKKNNGALLESNTVFYGASLSKPVFSVLVLKLVEEGKLDLDLPLRQYLPHGKLRKGKNWWEDFSHLEGNPWFDQVTARMCLSHTSGLPNWRWHEKDGKPGIKFKPGSRYSYSGEGFCYLQYVVNNITGRSLQSLVREKIFRPLGMHHSAYTWEKRFYKNYCYGHDEQGNIFEPDRDNQSRAASTLETTPGDYSLFLESVLRKQVLRPSLLADMFTSQISIQSEKQFGEGAEKNSSKYDTISLGYGLGWGLLNTPFGYGAFKEGHGNGFAHYLILFPGQGAGIMILSNHFKAESIYQPLLEIAIADTYTPFEWGGYISYKE